MELECFLRSKGVWYRLLNKPSTIHTKDASRVTGIPLNRITKSLVFKADGKPVLAVIPGDAKVDESKLAKVLGVRRVELASLEEAEKFSGYSPGGTPPVHHAGIEHVIFDIKLISLETIYGGGGAKDRLLELRVEDALKLTGGLVADISKAT
ncbi:MAG: aminoacyl-tRNA deacylase [Candidatus Bathyarchaeia archaeon]|nr:aminoacyl-tRNA deacylase [Candidatus Bathyarchaeota archaeon]